MSLGSGEQMMLIQRALEIWNAVDAVEYEWSIGKRARERFSQLTGLPIEARQGETSMALNRRVRHLVHAVLRDGGTTHEHAADLYDWIVAEWGGVKAGRDGVRAWASPDVGWHGGYQDHTLLAFADGQAGKRISSWSKIFAYAAPDDHAIYDSRVAVALNIALHRCGETARFFMPESKIYRPKSGAPRPNAVARARQTLGRDHGLGYRDYLVWAKAVREQLQAQGEPVDLLTIEARLFAAAPGHG